MARQL
jgi:hypothetical protein